MTDNIRDRSSLQQLHDAVYEAHILVCPPGLRFLDCRREECVNRRDALAAVVPVRGPHDRARDWTVDVEYQFGTEQRTVWVGPWEPVPNDIEATGECCCAGCIGMGPCDLDLGQSDDDRDDPDGDDDD